MPSRATRSKTASPSQGGQATGRIVPLSRLREFGWLLLLFCAVVLVYSPSLSSQFIWDDDAYVTENKTLKDTTGLWRIWTDPRATPQYYPFVHTTFWIEYRLWELNPVGYHLVNILLHAANTVLVAVILRRLNWPGALLAAVLFGLHPVHVESVSWVTERKNVLSGLFYLLSLNRLLNWWGLFDPPSDGNSQDPPRQHGLGEYVIGLLLYIAALLSKSVTCSLPAVILLILRQRKEKLTWRDVGFLAPMFAIGILLSINTIWLERAHVGASGEGFDLTPVERILIAGQALWFYAGKLIFPIGLSFIYPRWTPTTTEPLAWCATISAVVIPLYLFLRTRRLTAPLVAVLFFYGTLLPALGFFNIYPMRYSFVADHFQYLASLGMIVLIAALVQRQTLIVRAGISTVFVAVLALLTWQRQFVFHDRQTLWTDTLVHNPTAMVAYSHLGKLAFEAQNYPVAEAYFRNSLRHRTDTIEIYWDLTELAETLAIQKKYPEAVDFFQQALKYQPDFFDALNGWGTVEAEQGHFAHAIPLFERALTAGPTSDQSDRRYARLNLATALLKVDRVDDAERELRQILKETPTDAPSSFLISVQYPLAVLLVRQGRLSEAEKIVLSILKSDSKHGPALQLRQEIHSKSRPD